MADFYDKTSEQESGEVDFWSRVQKDEDAGRAAMVGQKDLGPSGLDDLKARFKVSAADTLEEKRTAFRQSYPEGDLDVLPVYGDLIYRKSKADPWAKVDPGIIEKREFGMDALDIVAQDGLSLAGEAVAAIGSGGGSLLGFLGRTFLGAFFGEVAQEGVEAAAGFSDQSASDIAMSAGHKAGFATGGAAAMSPIVGAFNIGRGRGIVHKSPEGKEAMAAAARLGLKTDLTPAMVSDNPIVRFLERQGASLVPSFRRRYQKIFDEVGDKALSLKDNRALAGLRQEMLDAHDRMRNRLLSAVGSAEGPEAGGKALIEGVAAYMKQSQKAVSALYDVAKGIEAPQFDIANMLSKIEAIETAGTTAARGGGKVQANPLSPALRDIIGRIKAVDPEFPAGEGLDDAVSTLRGFRTELFDLKTPPRGEPVRAKNRQAARLYAAIDDTLKAPRNTNPAFVDAWESASRAASDRFTTLEKTAIMTTAGSDTPASLAMKYAAPGQVDNLKVLRSTISGKRYQKFQDSFKAQLLESPDAISSKLKGFDKATLDHLMTPADQRVFRQLGADFDRLNLLNVQGAAIKQSKNRAFINDIVFDNLDKTGAMDSFVSMVRKSGGRNSPVGKAVRAGVIDNFLDRVFHVGTKELKAKAFEAELAALRKSSIMKVLNKQDIDAIRDLYKLLPALQGSGSDAGTELMAATAVSGLREFSGAAARTVLENFSIARIYLSKTGRMILLGKEGAQPGLGVPTRLLGATVATMVADTEKLPDLSDIYEYEQ